MQGLIALRLAIADRDGERLEREERATLHQSQGLASLHRPPFSRSRVRWERGELYRGIGARFDRMSGEGMEAGGYGGGGEGAAAER